MQVLTKRHHTETVDIQLTGPKDKMEDVLREIKKYGYVDTSDSIPWRELFPEFQDEPEDGVMLRGARDKPGLTQVELSHKTSIPQGHISQMENGKMEIGKERAIRLAEALNVNYRIFL